MIRPYLRNTNSYFGASLVNHHITSCIMIKRQNVGRHRNWDLSSTFLYFVYLYTAQEILDSEQRVYAILHYSANVTDRRLRLSLLIEASDAFGITSSITDEVSLSSSGLYMKY